MTASIGVVVIGRNEGERLRRCLDSLKDNVQHIVYVDSGSTDDSLDVARQAGAIVHELDMSRPFNPARARGEGFDRLMAGPKPTYVQFVDGDCEVQPGWVPTAAAYLEAHSDVGAVCGRRRERFPDATIWNKLIDLEWDTPPGEIKACGGDSLTRADAVAAVGGFDPGVVAGEEAEMCVRLRQAGWRIWRLDEEMTLHDAAMTRFGQWWKRTRRSGHGYAEGVAIHGAPPERHKVSEMWRAVVWGLAIPAAALLGGLLISPWAFLILLAWPAQILRLIARGELPLRAIFMTIGKMPEATGVLEYWLKRLFRRELSMINYK
ncbi:glycosyltransferase [Gymnodinialimonas sp. 2305UL16-5]|uniref:glycosyltransferase n=1 Tax=Gymnodinialimonas mytili TaxID=3126503 RepID=UPI0030A2E32C